MKKVKKTRCDILKEGTFTGMDTDQPTTFVIPNFKDSIAINYAKPYPPVLNGGSHTPRNDDKRYKHEAVKHMAMTLGGLVSRSQWMDKRYGVRKARHRRLQAANVYVRGQSEDGSDVEEQEQYISQAIKDEDELRKHLEQAMVNEDDEESVEVADVEDGTVNDDDGTESLLSLDDDWEN